MAQCPSLIPPWLRLTDRTIDNMNRVQRVEMDESHGQYRVRFVYPNGVADIATAWMTERDARVLFARYEAQLVSSLKTGGSNVFQDVRKYIADNRDMVYTILFVAVLDQLLFEGAFRERIKKLVDGFLTKAETKTAAIEGKTV